PDLNTIGDRGFTPRLARRWTWTPDSLSIAFEIDPRARWHDGRPVRASDVRFSFDVLRDPAVGSPFAGLVASIDSVTVRDSMTAVAWYKKRTPEQFYDFVYQVAIVPEHVYGAVPRAALKTSDLLRRPVGSGRFRFVRWEPGVRVEIAADTANYRGRANLDRVIWSISADGPSAAAKLFSGEADFWEFLTPDQLSRVAKDSALRVQPHPGLQYAFLGMNLHERKGTRPHPVFGEHAVRRALSMAVDRRAMLRNVFDTVGQISHGPFPRTQIVADTTLELPPYDVARAKALLDSAGWRDTPAGVRQKQGRPLEFTILVPQSSRTRMAYAVLLQEQLRGVGAKVNLETVDFPTFQARQDARDFDAATMAFSTDPGASGSKQYWHSSSAAKGGNNYVGYSNPRFDALLDSAIASFEPATAKAYARRAFEVLVRDAPAIWLYDLVPLAGVHRRIRVTGLRADGYWAGLADWHIPAPERIARDRVGLAAATR
ncbi:MAG: ABC transporter substrate-binding protein, partial [Gemmatimonadota bacterium]|nr:ABC transporter substrate-binding protein [Gemmatimonadota bacterium]